MLFRSLFIVFCITTLALAAQSEEPAKEAAHRVKAQKLYETKIRDWLNNPIVINAIKAQNLAHQALTNDDIQTLDKQWRNNDLQLISRLLDSNVSRYLMDVQDAANGLYTEIFVMDNKGLNVGQSNNTSDYWQGDEDKWLETFKIGPEAMHISSVSLDESTQTFQFQLSVTVSDETNTPIGAATIGLNAEILE